jgi:hypothetical protein
MATKKQSAIVEEDRAERRITDKLEAELHALRKEDDFAGGLPVVGGYPDFKDRDLSEFELDLRDWGFVYGLAFGLTMRDNRSCLMRTPRDSRSGRHIPSSWLGAERSTIRPRNGSGRLARWYVYSNRANGMSIGRASMPIRAMGAWR